MKHIYIYHIYICLGSELLLLRTYICVCVCDRYIYMYIHTHTCVCVEGCIYVIHTCGGMYICNTKTHKDSIRECKT